MNITQILTREEIRMVVADLRHRGRTSVNARQNLAIFRLSCCCGLRAKEMCGLNCGDFTIAGSRPCIRIRKETSKAHVKVLPNGSVIMHRRGRIVPLWWDRGTLEDLTVWLRVRAMANALVTDPFLCQQSLAHGGRRMTGNLLALRWRTALRRLEPDRIKQLHIHCGRHTFCSLALDAGHSLAAVRDAAGHANIATTSIYLHTVERRGVPDICGDE